MNSAVRLSRPTAVLCDLGGTLLREDAYDLEAGVAALMGQARMRDGVDSGVGAAAVADLSRRIDDVHRSGNAEFTLALWLDEQWLPEDGRTHDELEASFWRATARLSPMPHVVDALSELQMEQIPVGVVSNAIFSGKTLRSELELHGLWPALDLVLSSADLRIRKPDHRIFQHALSHLSAPAAATWFVGDSWENDVVGAANAGLTPIWLSETDRPPSNVPHVSIRTWRDFVRLYRSAR